MIIDRMGEPGDLRMQLGSNRLHAEPLKRADERMREAVQSVTVSHDAFALHIVKNFAHLVGRKLVMIEKRNKADDRSLKVNVVLPERIVRVNQKSLGRQLLAPSR